MTFPRESGVTFTDMCIYIDNNIYDPSYDEERCYKYMYHIFYTLATKNRFFNCERDYDEYALYGASRLLLRYKKKNLAIIKSVLNYVKSILYPTKVEYQAQTFNHVFKQDVEEEVALQLRDQLTFAAITQNDNLMRTEFNYYLYNIPKTILEFIKKSPYCDNKLMLHNIYISCLLSVVNAITLNNENKKRVENRLKRSAAVDMLLETVYYNERKDPVVLYNVDDSMYNYIYTLVNRIFHIISSDLIYIIGSYEPTGAIIQSILSSSIEDNSEENN